MPKKIGVYVTDEDAVFYEKDFKPAVEQAGDTVGKVFAIAMRDYVDCREVTIAQQKKFKLFIGERHSYLGNAGEYVEFTGKLIGEDKKDEKPEHGHSQALYRTRKQKLLLLEEKWDPDSRISEYRIFENLRELVGIYLLPSITRALRDEDFGVRQLDI